MSNVVVKDFKDWWLPTSWNDISLKTFQEIQRYYDGMDDREIDYRDLLKIFSNKTDDEINMLPADFLEKMLIMLQFLNEKPLMDEPTNKIEYNGEEYVVNTMEKMKFGEFVDTQTAIKNDKTDLASIMAILCRKKGEIYDSDFIANKFDDRKAMYENMPITKVYPVIAFFLTLWIQLETPSALYLTLKEEIDHTLKLIETSKTNGDGSISYTRSDKRTLKKLQKQLNSLQRKYSFFSPI